MLVLPFGKIKIEERIKANKWKCEIQREREKKITRYFTKKTWKNI